MTIFRSLACIEPFPEQWQNLDHGFMHQLSLRNQNIEAGQSIPQTIFFHRKQGNFENFHNLSYIKCQYFMSNLLYHAVIITDNSFKIYYYACVILTLLNSYLWKFCNLNLRLNWNLSFLHVCWSLVIFIRHFYCLLKMTHKFWKKMLVVFVFKFSWKYVH